MATSQYTQSEVNLWFESYRCKLLSPYVNQKNELVYLCKCGQEMHNSFVRLKKFCKDPYGINCRREEKRKKIYEEIIEVIMKYNLQGSGFHIYKKIPFQHIARKG
ncbi:hypothetical protein AYJ08_18295 [Brevibacillus sp. SKDU10]|nr:hypothetical protein AYJ08_18295 [Brevibacillus sp. SKDU10]